MSKADIQRLLWTVAGALSSRGVRPEVDQTRRTVTAWFDTPTEPRDAALHRRAVQSLLDVDGVEARVTPMGESGFTVELRPTSTE